MKNRFKLNILTGKWSCTKCTKEFETLEGVMKHIKKHKEDGLKQTKLING